MSKSMATTLAVCSAGIAFLAYLYMKLIMAGYEVTIPLINVTISL